MATVLIASQPYTTYATETEADLYLAAALHATAWAAATDEVKAQALVTATRIFDRQSWLGSKTDADQALAWPRTGTGVTGVEDDVIPQDIIDGSIELAAALVDGADVQNQSTTEEQVKRIKAGSVEIENFRSTRTFFSRFPTIIQELVGKYLSGGGAAFGAPIASGTDATSPFDDEYDFNEGL